MRVRREVSVAQSEPRFVAEPGERTECVERLALEPPTLRGIDRSGQRVDDDIDIGRDANSEEVLVIADIRDDCDVALRDDLDQSLEESCRTDAARKCCDLHSRSIRSEKSIKEPDGRW